MPIIGREPWLFECVHDWGQVPDDIVLGETHGVVEDSQGLIYVFHTVGKGSGRRDAMLVFDESGRMVRSWGSEFAGTAHGLHLHREGGGEFLYLSNHKAGTVVKTTLEGRVIWSAGWPKESGLYQKAQEYKPTNVAISPDGRLYVADGYGLGHVHIYTLDGEYRRSFGGVGDEPGKFRCPHGLFVDVQKDGDVLLVADRGNRRVQKLSLDGDPLGVLETGSRLPCHFKANSELMVLPDLMSRVTLLNEMRQPVIHLGAEEDNRKLRAGSRASFPAGGFVAPHDATFDRSGNLFVVEWVPSGRISKLRKIT